MKKFSSPLTEYFAIVTFKTKKEQFSEVAKRKKTLQMRAAPVPDKPDIDSVYVKFTNLWTHINGSLSGARFKMLICLLY